jgi:hypothetical protein
MSPRGPASHGAEPRRAARGRLATTCLAGAVVLLLPTVLAGYAQRTLLDSEQFANRAAAALQQESVRSRIAQEVTDDVVLANAGDLITARPIIEQVTADIVGGAAFRQLFRAGVLDVHRATFDRDRDTVTLTLVDVGTVVGAALEQLRPSLAAQIRDDTRVTVLRRDIDERATALARQADRIDLLAGILAALALALAAAGVALAADRRLAVARLGAGAAAVGIVIVVGYAVARSIALERVSGAENREVLGAVWDAFLADLRTAGWVLAGSGAVVAAAAASLLRPVEIEPALRRLRHWVVTEPSSPALRVVRGLALIVGGVLLVARPALVLGLVATLAGVYLVYAGLQVLLRLVYRPERAAATRRLAHPGRRLAVAGIAAVVIAGGWAAFAAGGGTSEAAPAVTGCNGHRELCDVPLDRVVLPATHNAMSAPQPDWFSSQQDAPIADQLDDGIRGLLIDTHYGDRLPNGRVRTDLGAAPARIAAEDGVGEEAFAAAQRIRERLGFRGSGERGMYLCHSFCELGALPLADVLETIHDFLVTHPGEVLVVINQDYVTPSDFVDAVDRAGLTDLIVTPPAGGDAWPTLGELIRDNRRLVVLAENEAGAAPWYQLVYERLTEETPFSFNAVEQLTESGGLAASCEPNRGSAGAPLFLVNHWITTDPVPRPSNAAVVNAREPLLRRARECGRIRDHVANLLAVDFYRRGDLFDVVDTLNGVG